MVLLWCTSVYDLAVLIVFLFSCLVFTMSKDFTYCILNMTACIFTLYILLLFVIFNNRWMMIWEECVVSPPLMAFFNAPSDAHITPAPSSDRSCKNEKFFFSLRYVGQTKKRACVKKKPKRKEIRKTMIT